MGFRVEVDALRNFSGLLAHYSEDARSIQAYARNTCDVDFKSKGLLQYVMPFHTHANDRAAERVGFLVEIGTNSSQNINKTASFYENTDQQNAARLDSTYYVSKKYTPNNHQLISGSPDPGASRSFTYVEDPTQYLQGLPDGGDLAPKAAEIAKWVTQVGEYVSVMYWVRQLIQQVIGYDIFEEVIQFFTGDWEAWAEVAGGWQQCGKAVGALAENIRYSDEALAQVWEGNAADAARGFFQDFTWATECEVQFFEYLYKYYAEVVDVAYQAYEKVSDSINVLLDILATAGIAAVGKAILKVPTVIAKIWEIVDFIVNIMTGAKTQVYDLGISSSIRKAIGLAFNEPVSKAQTMAYGSSSGYAHPAVS